MGLEKIAQTGIGKLAFKQTTKSLTNLGTGIKLRKGFSAAAIGAGIAWGIGTGLIQVEHKDIASRAEYGGNLDVLDYDANPNVNRMTGDRTFGATGALVFGLNNSRHG